MQGVVVGFYAGLGSGVGCLVGGYVSKIGSCKQATLNMLNLSDLFLSWNPRSLRFNGCTAILGRYLLCRGDEVLYKTQETRPHRKIIGG